jgi:hypothetical protein
MNRSCLETGQIDPFETGDRNPHAAGLPLRHPHSHAELPKI